MLVWFNSPTLIILPRRTLSWLRVARQWLQPVLPNLTLKWRGISTKHKLLAQKPYKLAPLKPENHKDIAALMVYYGVENPPFAISLLSEFIQINCVVTDPAAGFSIYQIYPFHYYFTLPEPIPPPDAIGENRLAISELSIFYPYLQRQRRKIEPTSIYLNLCLTIYYLTNFNEWNFGDESVRTTLQNNIIEFIQTTQPDKFLWFVALALLFKHNWQNAIPHQYLTDINWVRYAYYQSLHCLDLGI